MRLPPPARRVVSSHRLPRRRHRGFGATERQGGPEASSGPLPSSDAEQLVDHRGTPGEKASHIHASGRRRKDPAALPSGFFTTTLRDPRNEFCPVASAMRSSAVRPNTHALTPCPTNSSSHGLSWNFT